MKFLRTIGALALLLTLTAFLSGCDIQYSDGDRVGVITKLSNKGLIAKTWEGTMALDSFSPTTSGSSKNARTVMSNAFDFSVKDQKFVELLQTAMDSGLRVKIHYDQLILFNPLTQSSPYLVTDVHVLELPKEKDKSEKDKE